MLLFVCIQHLALTNMDTFVLKIVIYPDILGLFECKFTEIFTN